MKEDLEKAHKKIGRAGFQVVTMIVKSRFSRKETETAISNLQDALSILNRLADRSGKR